MHVEYVANGMGSQSMYLLWLAIEKRIPATISMTADTGWEDDSDLCDGTKITARGFFDQHIRPLATKHGIEAYFVRSVRRDGTPELSIPEYLKKFGAATVVPLFGSNGGRLKQNCTDKWKAKGMAQQARRLGATTCRSAQGIHWGERARRVKGRFLLKENGFDIYRSTIKRKDRIVEVKWRSHYYPLVDLRMTRDDVIAECTRLGLPYLVSSECQGCPHADPWRWMRRSPETIAELDRLEASWEGEYFFTKSCRPLAQLVDEWRKAEQSQGILDFNCEDGYCGV